MIAVMMGQRGFCVSVFSSQYLGSMVYKQPKGLEMNATDVKECRVCSKVITKVKRDMKGFCCSIMSAGKGRLWNLSGLPIAALALNFVRRSTGRQGEEVVLGKGLCLLRSPGCANNSRYPDRRA